MTAKAKQQPRREDPSTDGVKDSSQGLDWHKAYLDRDLGWLEFNRRVLHEALDERTPLLERLKFLGIFTSNLDEFFMKRAEIFRQSGDILMQVDAQKARTHHDKLRTTVIEMLEQQARCFADVVRPKLSEHGIRLLDWQKLSEEQQKECAAYFDKNISPALTPLALDPGHPFPFLSNLSTSLGFVLRLPDSEEPMFARVKVPSILPAWLPLGTASKKGNHDYVRLQDIILQNAPKLFPGMVVSSMTLFRVTRNAEVDIVEEQSESVLAEVEEELRQRKFEPVVRLELSKNPDPWVRNLLIQKFELTESDVYEMSEELDYTALMPLAFSDVRELRDEPWTPLVPPGLADGNIFEIIRAKDILVHHPYESFDASVEHFIRSAADDPDVVAVKMTVYRVGDDTPFVKSLIRAAEAGKQVACVIELHARFDEERNLHWAHELEKVGAHVVFGVLGLKTHAKLALVVRKEAGQLRCYAHMGTGNYHVKTARLYADLGLFTCDPVLTGDVVNLFHYLTGRARLPHFEKLLAAPINMRDRFLAMVEREIEHQQAGRPAHIIAKFNQLEDPALCQAICRASCAGVQVDMIIRGFSVLRPGVPGLTENVRIRSIIGRFLEHSRIYYFRNGASEPADGEFFIGSADWMTRNLSRRVESITPVAERTFRDRLWEILEIMKQDCRQAWEMQTDGKYKQLTPPTGDKGPAGLGSHQILMDRARHRLEEHLCATEK
ncbi:MAG: polyphosphate kinase 1 [Gemmataceae bacterium]